MARNSLARKPVKLICCFPINWLHPNILWIITPSSNNIKEWYPQSCRNIISCLHLNSIEYQVLGTTDHLEIYVCAFLAYYSEKLRQDQDLGILDSCPPTGGSTPTNHHWLTKQKQFDNSTPLTLPETNSKKTSQNQWKRKMIHFLLVHGLFSGAIAGLHQQLLDVQTICHGRHAKDALRFLHPTSQLPSL